MRSSISGTPGSWLPALFVAASLGACTTASVPNPFAETAAPAPSFDPSEITPNEITRDEIRSRSRNDHTAMAVIRRLRPRWLSVRGQDSLVDGAASYPVVYIDEIRHGGLPSLHRIPTAEILRLEYYSMADATIRWGTGHPSGAINVVTGRF